MAGKVTDAQVRKAVAALDAGRMPERHRVSDVVTAFADVLRKPGLWGDETSQIAGLRRLSVLEISTRDAINEKGFADRMVQWTVFQALPAAILAVASTEPDAKVKKSLREYADYLLYEAPLPGRNGGPVVAALSEIDAMFEGSRWKDLERGTMDSDVQAVREFTIQATRQAKMACMHSGQGELADAARAAAWVGVAAGMAVARKEAANQQQADRIRRRNYQMDCVAEVAAQTLVSLEAPAREPLRLMDTGKRAGAEAGGQTEEIRSPWVMQPDAASHGCQLAVVNSETGAILARTPECDEYGARGQMVDMANAELMALAPVLHKTVLEAEKALREIERFDGRMAQEERCPTGEDYNEVCASVRAALAALMPTVELMRRSADNVIAFEREYKDTWVEQERDGDEEESERDEQVSLSR